MSESRLSRLAAAAACTDTLLAIHYNPLTVPTDNQGTNIVIAVNR